MTKQRNPYERLVGFVNRYNVSPKDEMEYLRPIIAEIVEWEKNKDHLTESGKMIDKLEQIEQELFGQFGTDSYEIRVEIHELIEQLKSQKP